LEKKIKTQDEVMSEALNLISDIGDDVATIKGWVTFIGIIVLITQLFGLLASCGVL